MKLQAREVHSQLVISYIQYESYKHLQSDLMFWRFGYHIERARPSLYQVVVLI